MFNRTKTLLVLTRQNRSSHTRSLYFTDVSSPSPAHFSTTATAHFTSCLQLSSHVSAAQSLNGSSQIPKIPENCENGFTFTVITGVAVAPRSSCYTVGPPCNLASRKPSEDDGGHPEERQSPSYTTLFTRSRLVLGIQQTLKVSTQLPQSQVHVPFPSASSSQSF